MIQACNVIPVFTCFDSDETVYINFYGNVDDASYSEVVYSVIQNDKSKYWLKNISGQIESNIYVDHSKRVYKYRTLFFLHPV